MKRSLFNGDYLKAKLVRTIKEFVYADENTPSSKLSYLSKQLCICLKLAPELFFQSDIRDTCYVLNELLIRNVPERTKRAIWRAIERADFDTEIFKFRVEELARLKKELEEQEKETPEGGEGFRKDMREI